MYRTSSSILTTAVFLAGVLVSYSCENEMDVSDRILERQSLSVVMQETNTRAEGSVSATFRYPLNYQVDGQAFCLEETVVNLDDSEGLDAPVTRGTPLYTENVTRYHNMFNGAIFGDDNALLAGDDAFQLFESGTGQNYWHRLLGFDPWLSSDELTLFLRLPSTQPGVSNLTYTNTSETHSLAFDFATPATASAQQDILFATRTIDEATYLSELESNGGAGVLFRHALTGVKFAIANNAPVNGIRTFITGVTLKGLKDKGHAVFVPVGTETSVDNINEHTSAASFTWTDITMDDEDDPSGESGDDDEASSTVSTGVFTQTFTPDQVRNFESGDALGAPASFYAGGQNNNLNDADASLTFWFIPQEITSAVKLEVTFYILDGESAHSTKTVELELGNEILKQVAAGRNTNKEWKAGQLRTFTLKADLAAVEITDQVSGFTKNQVVIRNTGNIPVYFRAAIVANWFGTKDYGTLATEDDIDGIALGYSSSNSRDYFVESWRMTGTTGSYGDNYGGVFTGLPGTGWVRCADGYFYYTQPVAPGTASGSPLFVSYSIDAENKPDIWYLHDLTLLPFTNVRLVMQIPVQAVEAKTGKNYQQAWADAGVTVTTP